MTIPLGSKFYVRAGAGYTWREEGEERYELPSDARPVAVIDPEDPEQVERLAYELLDIHWYGTIDDIRDALRRLVKPLPPEPAGLGALVRRTQGNGVTQRWVRGPSGWTNLDATGPFLNWSDWSDVVDDTTAIETLRAGVTD